MKLLERLPNLNPDQDLQALLLNIRQQPCGRYIPRTPRSEFIPQFIALLEKSQVMRADFLAGGRMGLGIAWQLMHK